MCNPTFNTHKIQYSVFDVATPIRISIWSMYIQYAVIVWLALPPEDAADDE